MKSLYKMAGILLLVTGSIGARQMAAQSDETKSRSVAPGVEHQQIRRGDPTGEKGKDRWLINLLVIDTTRVTIRLGQAMDEIAGAETTSSLARRLGAIAAINGGYFRTTGIVRGEPVGFLSIGDKILSEPVRNRAALALSDDGTNVKATFSRISLTAELTIDRRVLRGIDGFNRPREKDELIVYTPEFHRTTLTEPDGIEATVVDGRVVSLDDGRGSRLIPHNGVVISAAGKAREMLSGQIRKGMRIGYITRMVADPPIGFRPDFIIGGGPRLLAGGLSVIADDASAYAEGFYTTRHPRTAIGLRADGSLLLVTVDGRQPESSVGMSIEELTRLMRELGCIDAMNLDGGGSTTMVVNNEIVNLPSDKTGERPVSDALLIFLR